MFLQKRNDQLKSTNRLSSEKKAQSNDDKKSSHIQLKQSVETNEESKALLNEVCESDPKNKRPKSEASEAPTAQVINDEEAKKLESNEVNGSGGRGKQDGEEEAVVATTMAST